MSFSSSSFLLLFFSCFVNFVWSAVDCSLERSCFQCLEMPTCAWCADSSTCKPIGSCGSQEVGLWSNCPGVVSAPSAASGGGGGALAPSLPGAPTGPPTVAPASGPTIPPQVLADLGYQTEDDLFDMSTIPPAAGIEGDTGVLIGVFIGFGVLMCLIPTIVSVFKAARK